MKSLEQIYILNYLSDEVWRAVTGLLDVVERFDRADKADKETVKKFYYEDAVNSLEMWRTLIGNHTKTWEDSLNKIDLTEVNVELLDDCPDNNTLQNRLRIIENRYFGTWEITKAGERDVVFDKLLHIVDRLTEILFSVYDWSKDDAHRKAVKWHDYLLQKWCNVGQLQNYMQSVIANAESILNPQPDTTTEQEQMIRQASILEDAEIKAVMQAVEGIGLMVQKDCWYYWTGDNALLSYLCSEISRYKEYSKQMREDEYLPNWIKFEGIFKAKGRKKDEWVEVDSNRLANYKKQYKKYHQRFSPDGCKDIDEIIERCIKI